MSTYPSANNQVIELVDALSNLIERSSNSQFSQDKLQLLKEQADKYWGIDPRISYIVAQLIIALGDLEQDEDYIALGTMAKGDAQRFLGNSSAAYATLSAAGEIFKSIGNEIGWARTRIGRLLASQEVSPDAIQAALIDVEEARRVFLRNDEIDLLVRLTINLSAFHYYRSEFTSARKVLSSTLNVIDAEESIQSARLLHNLGLVEQVDGNHNIALSHYKRAEDLFQSLEQTYEVARVVANRAAIWMIRGQYREALETMQTIHEQLDPSMQVTNSCNQLICYQLIGAHEKAKAIADDLLNRDDTMTLIDKAAVHMYLGESLAFLEYFDDAVVAFDTAETYLQQANSPEVRFELLVRRALVHLKADKFPDANSDAKLALGSTDLYVRINAYLVMSYAELNTHIEVKLERAKHFAANAYYLARQLDMDLMRYRTSILLGKIREIEVQDEKAIMHYKRAHRQVLNIQSTLSADHRPGYLESTQDALHHLIRAYLQSGSVEEALITLEELKSLVVHQNQHEFCWRGDIQDPDYKNFYKRLKHAQWKYLKTLMRDHNLKDIGREELHQRFRQQLDDLIVENRVLASRNIPNFEASTLEEIVSTLPADSKLIEYYSDGNNLFAFILSHDESLYTHQFDASYKTLIKLTQQLRRLIGRALAVGYEEANRLYRSETDSILHYLYQILIEPLCSVIDKYNQLVIVPYGILHLVPFHLLFDGTHYLMEHDSLQIRLTSTQYTRKKLASQPGVLALGYNENDPSYRMEKEVKRITDIINGNSFVGQQAVSQQLSRTPHQILHIAAHGKHYVNQPRMSHLCLADGKLFMDDLWQFDLNYDLVMLSACSVGGSYPSGGDELIGLGHRFLYAGAASLISSLWDVDDLTADSFTTAFYTQLRSGSSKQNAVKYAQMQLKHDSRFQHPAYWGTFQLLINSDQNP